MGNCCCCSFPKGDVPAEPQLTPRQRLLAVFGTHAPLRLKDVDDILQDYNNDGERALRYYSAVLGPEPKPDEAKQLYATYLTKDDIALRQCVHHLLLKYDPTRIVELESIVLRHKVEKGVRGGKAGEMSLIQQLKQRYSGKLAKRGGGVFLQPGSVGGDVPPPPLPLQSDELLARGSHGATHPPSPSQSTLAATDRAVALGGTPAPLPLATTVALPTAGQSRPRGKRDEVDTGDDDADGILRKFDAILAHSRYADVAALLPYRAPAKQAS
ncbi:hypothetical protein TraAM80_01360 [Trypanosoma rangeli]|uniref:Uncharacterized protein n=1 Tax=Trypanosoma rangeli TaxID=5698 RepID=A0A3S5ISE6_TRYRA|nr:uncharacterized protein TraAM80_01360 [Trypanosoma rangeli]RNF10816.1 hypothetical protein TraAM80_01360 [Trypanosoma rangeli]|eukprot:RNF10816.1 hypothetical protein TraAM80_01360 [Trypanosoma rangeli]